MNYFTEFQKTYKTSIDCKVAENKAIKHYQDKLPVPLIEFWKTNGWCGYAEGLIWTVNPSDFHDTLKNWVKSPSDNFAIVFVRTAFGDLFLWYKGIVYYLNIQNGKITSITNDIFEFFDDFLCRENILKKVLKQDIFQDAFKNLGQLKFDECYAFVPTLALGGSGEIDTLQKVKLREHLGLLAQLIRE